MIFSRFTRFSGRDAFSLFCFPILMAGSCLLASCEDDTDFPHTSAYISFTPQINTAWAPATRSEGAADAPRNTVTALQGSGPSLFLHTLYTDSIASPSSKDNRDAAPLTRATPVSETNMYDNIGVSAYAYTDTWDETRTPNYMYNVTASKSGSDYLLASTYYWPGASYKIRFFAYAPTANDGYALSGSTHAGAPVISVTVPRDVSRQQDLLVAQTGELNGDNSSAVPLNFNHALTAIRFVCGNDMQSGTVKSVSLKNVYSRGEYNMETKGWNSLDDLATFSQELNQSTTGSGNQPLTSGAQTFMMIPQTLPENAQIEVVFTDNTDTDHTLTADIGHTQWPMGKTVTYRISSSSINWNYTLTVTDPTGFTYQGGTQLYSVVSYRENGKGVREAVAWSTEYSTDGGQTWSSDKPDWLSAFTTSGNGGESTETFSATVDAQTGTESTTHTATLRNAAAKGSDAAPYNLSNSNGEAEVQNTANSYVVNAPGIYSIPLVYGNAIKEGVDNKSAYTSKADGDEILKTFVNHAGAEIKDPYISNNGCTPASAELVWQDAPSLLTGIRYDSGGGTGGSIVFKVNEETIRQGNAVVAIKDDQGAILWSWHVWVTDEAVDKTVGMTNRQNHTYNFMPVALGWCDAYTTDYAERTCQVRFTAGNETKVMTISQAAGSFRVGDNHPYYQWGRKDPFLPSGGIDNTNKTWYKADGTASTASPATANHSTGISCIQNYILKPDVMHNLRQGDGTYANLWSADNNTHEGNDNEVVKTIYDPCPVGFKLPASNAFTGFVPAGGQVNGTWDNVRKGWYIYSEANKTGTQSFFSNTGWRHYNGTSLHDVGGLGYYWLAIPWSGIEAGHALLLTSSGGKALEFVTRPCGLGIRPVQE